VVRVQLTVAQGRGAPRQIELEAASLVQARAMAEHQGYAVLASRPLKPGGTWWLPRRARATFDVPVFIEQLRDLLTAGLSVIEALDALRRGAKGDSTQVIQRVEQLLREGKTLSDALAADEAFPPDGLRLIPEYL
jgi:general secretion pathway protein F